MRCPEGATACGVTGHIGRLFNWRAAQRTGPLTITPFLRAILAKGVAASENDGGLHGLVADGTIRATLLNQLRWCDTTPDAVLIREQLGATGARS